MELVWGGFHSSALPLAVAIDSPTASLSVATEVPRPHDIAQIYGVGRDRIRGGRGCRASFCVAGGSRHCYQAPDVRPPKEPDDDHGSAVVGATTCYSRSPGDSSRRRH